jgi:hypothetical protein
MSGHDHLHGLILTMESENSIHGKGSLDRSIKLALHVGDET